jgi:hypothetical protein
MVQGEYERKTSEDKEIEGRIRDERGLEANFSGDFVRTMRG